MKINQNVTKTDWITQIKATRPRKHIAHELTEQGYMIEVSKNIYEWNTAILNDIEIDTIDPETGRQLFDVLLNKTDSII